MKKIYYNERGLLMFSSGLILGVGLLPGLMTSPVNAQMIPSQTASTIANSMLFSLVKVVGPKGELLSYENNNDEIAIRLCADDTSNDEIEKGCPLKAGTLEVKVNINGFRQLLNSELYALDPMELTDEQQELLKRALAVDPKSKEAKLLPALEAALKKNQKSKLENPEDYDASRERDLKRKIQHILDGQNYDIALILKAKRDVADLIESLIGNMNTKKIQRTLRYSADRTGIAFHLLKQAYSVEACDLSTVKNATAGYWCYTTKHVLFKVEARSRGHVVLRDTKSELLVSDQVAEDVNRYGAAKLCSDPSTLAARGNLTEIKWSLPTYYWQPPYRDTIGGDFWLLEQSGIREVREMKDHSYWSSSAASTESYGDAIVYVGDNGDIWSEFSSKSNSALCVGR
jgi:hypothetical protein